MGTGTWTQGDRVSTGQAENSPRCWRNAQVTREGITVPVGLEGTDSKKHLCAYRAAIIRGSDVPALLGIDALRRMDALIRCRTGEMWFLGEKGCDITPKGKHVHLQMKKGKSGHWYLPSGRFSNAMEKMAVGHLATNSASSGASAARTAIHSSPE